MISSLNSLIKKISSKIITKLKNCNLINLVYDENGKLMSTINIDYKHSGIYSFILKKEQKTIVVYIGKNEGGDRLRQHITGENKDGTILKSSVRTKHLKIKESIKNGYCVYLATFEDCDFNKASLSAIEIGCIEYLKDLNTHTTSPLNGEWNTRIS